MINVQGMLFKPNFKKKPPQLKQTKKVQIKTKQTLRTYYSLVLSAPESLCLILSWLVSYSQALDTDNL